MIYNNPDEPICFEKTDRMDYAWNTLIFVVSTLIIYAAKRTEISDGFRLLRLEYLSSSEKNSSKSISTDQR